MREELNDGRAELRPTGEAQVWSEPRKKREEETDENAGGPDFKVRSGEGEEDVSSKIIKEEEEEH